MRTADEGRRLSLRSRDITVSLSEGDAGRRGSLGRYTGLLPAFSGILDTRISSRDWPPTALSHLTLGLLASVRGMSSSATATDVTSSPRRPETVPRSFVKAPSVVTRVVRTEMGSTRPTPEPQNTRTRPEDSSETEADPRVRDVIRQRAARPAPPDPGTAPGLLDDGRRLPRAVGVPLTPVRTRGEVRDGRSDGTANERSLPDDDPTQDGAESSASTVSEWSTTTVPAVRTTVVERRGAERATESETDDETARSGSVGAPERQESSATGPDWGSRVADRPRPSVSDVRIAESLATTSRMEDTQLTTLAGTSPGDSSAPQTVVGSTVATVHPSRTDDRRSILDPPDPPAGDTPDAVDSHESAMSRDRTDAAPDPDHSDMSRGGRRVRRTLLRSAGRGDSGVARPTGDPSAMTSDGVDAAQLEQVAAPSLVVRRGRTFWGSERGDRPGADRPADTVGSVRTNGSPNVSSPSNRSPSDRPSRDQSPRDRPPSRHEARTEGKSAERIDEMLDVDALVQRLLRAFERTDRIERERRG